VRGKERDAGENRIEVGFHNNGPFVTWAYRSSGTVRAHPSAHAQHNGHYYRLFIDCQVLKPVADLPPLLAVSLPLSLSLSLSLSHLGLSFALLRRIA
jgi:hypothetical protein